MGDRILIIKWLTSLPSVDWGEKQKVSKASWHTQPLSSFSEGISKKSNVSENPWNCLTASFTWSTISALRAEYCSDKQNILMHRILRLLWKTNGWAEAVSGHLPTVARSQSPGRCNASSVHPCLQEHRWYNSLKERKWAKWQFQTGSLQQKYLKYRIIRDQAMEPGAWEILWMKETHDTFILYG